MEQRSITMPSVALRGLVVFPYMVIHFEVARDTSIAALERAMAEDQRVFLVTQKEMRIESPGRDDLYDVGVVAKVRHILRLPGDSSRVMVEGLYRARLLSLRQGEFLEAEVISCEEDWDDGDEKTAYMRLLMQKFEEYANAGNRISQETLLAVGEIKSAAKLADTVAVSVFQRVEEKQLYLELCPLKERYERLISAIGQELKVLAIERDINMRTRAQIEKLQKEHYLREQIKTIQTVLGDTESEQEEAAALREKLSDSRFPEQVREKVLKELSRMEKMSSQTPDYHVIRTYLDWIISLPFGITTEDNLDLENAAAVLDKDHYGLQKVKERVLEYLAVLTLKNDMKGPILCFAGPPGVGKTSIARSIAEALGKKFVRIALGGVRDEAEIRGHRRTYIGAIPGRIISSMKQAGSMNPLFLLDEIDKMNADFRGDPASAMLEVLDPMMNGTFSDHYLDMEFDLSQVMFVTTANDIESIPGPLFDRMEVIELPGYTSYEKREIATRHLIPHQIEENGLTPKILKFESPAVDDIISEYTAESGVRSLERQIAEVCRKAAKQYIDGRKRITVRRNNLEKYLGIPRFHDTRLPQEDKAGVVIGLAWTSAGGTTMPIEVSVMEGTGKLELTGKLGDVMQESARTGLSLIRSMAARLGIEPEFYKDKDIHIHVPEGAVPKDGPSAGITMALGLTSALTGRKVRHNIAMTGEITLTGRVLAIGGLREKSLAALRSGITRIIIPSENKRDIEEIPEEIRRQITFVPVDEFTQVLREALV